MAIMDCVFRIGPAADATVADDLELTADMRRFTASIVAVIVEFEHDVRISPL